MSGSDVGSMTIKSVFERENEQNALCEKEVPLLVCPFCEKLSRLL